MAEQPLKAEFFVTRKDGKMVPLVAVDELPHHIAVASVSRVMSPFDIAGMTCIGRSDFRHRHYSVNNAPELAASHAVNGRDALKAKYFVTRDSGNMVPLLAMDEMPEHFVIEGVPRHVTVFDIAGMTCVGLGEAREQVHVVEDVNNAPMSYFTEKASLEDAFSEPESLPGTPVVRLGPFSSDDNIVQSVEDDLSPPSTMSKATTPSPLNLESERTSGGSPLVFDTPQSTSRPTSSAGHHQPAKTPDQAESKTTAVPAFGMKKYCSYWIRHGECDYQQQGCLYKHEMPLDSETLSQLGLRDIPRWYREKHCLGSFLAAGGAGASFSGPGLKSAVAAGVHQQESGSKFMNNWRGGQGNNFRSPPQGGPRGLSNVYGPRSPQFAMNPHSFSRFPAAANNAAPFINGKLRRHETVESRRQLEALEALQLQEQATESRRYMGPSNIQGGAIAETTGMFEPVVGSPIGHSRRRSASTIISDIEALVGRQDAERRAREDAEYAKVCEEDRRQKAVESAKAALEKKDGSNKGSSNGGRGGRNNRGRGRQGRGGNKAAGKTTPQTTT